MRVWVALGVAALVLAVTACGGSDDSDSTTPVSSASGLTDIDGVDQFERSFESDTQRAQLVLLLAPT